MESQASPYCRSGENGIRNISDNECHTPWFLQMLSCKPLHKSCHIYQQLLEPLLLLPLLLLSVSCCRYQEHWDVSVRLIWIWCCIGRDTLYTLMMEYMMGWVNIGSSISLCPNFLYPTRSITTSLCQVALHSAAILATSITASGSSAFTWKIGALTTRPTSVQYGLDLEYLGSVVNPIWLLATMWTVPLIKKNGFNSLKFCW